MVNALVGREFAKGQGNKIEERKPIDDEHEYRPRRQTEHEHEHDGIRSTMG